MSHQFRELLHQFSIISVLGERLQGEKSKDGENLVRGVSAAMQQANDDEEDD